MWISEKDFNRLNGLEQDVKELKEAFKKQDMIQYVPRNWDWGYDQVPRFPALWESFNVLIRHLGLKLIDVPGTPASKKLVKETK